ncbi:MAG: hypothetical protein GF317_09920, partial [Candidatus Lokiarchaeota archaeon]|nr:hypothetical protein [Candidatus Lokiarchaeota archaeon]MBD3200001.1 hypothetical protein [Candidatus Lokiarchaeota archaeon]
MLRKLLFFIYNLKNYRFKVFKFINEYIKLNNSLYQSIENNRAIQKKRLYRLLKHASLNIPYYQEIVREKRINISLDTIFEDIRKFPILTKELLRENWDLLHSDLKYKKYSINTSGGTTGEPVRFIQTRKYKILNECGKIVFNQIGGYYPGNRLVKLWGNEKDILGMSEGFLKPIENKFFRNIFFQNSFKMSNQDLREYIYQINKIKPNTILAYVQSIYEMAKFIRRNGLAVFSPKSIITSAGILTSEMKEYIEDTFNCEVFNRYGSREVSVIGSSCEVSEKIHIN